ncbi:MAG: glycosyltransferase, partial [Chloroflexota bacterium]
MDPDLSVIIVSYNTRDLLESCLTSVFKQNVHGGLDVWVVDNASADGSAAMVRERFPRAKLIANAENRGFAAANNQAIQASAGRYLLILNPDTEILSGSLDRVIQHLDSHPRIAVAGCRLVYADGSFQHSAFRFPGLRQAFLDLFPIHGRLLDSALNGRYPRSAYEREMEIDHPLGACFILRRTGLTFDEAYFM